MDNNPKYIEMDLPVACKLKWQKGQEVYGKEFVGHPLEQFAEEIIDATNYVEEAKRWGYSMDVMDDTLKYLFEEVKRIYKFQHSCRGK